MNRREVMLSVATLPLIPYIGTKYTTPETDRVVYKLINNIWTEFPFDELIKGDIIRISTIDRVPDDTVFRVSNVFTSTNDSIPNGITLFAIQF